MKSTGLMLVAAAALSTLPVAAQNRSQDDKNSPLDPASAPLVLPLDSTLIHLDIDEDVDQDMDLDNDIDVDVDLEDIRTEQKEAMKELREQMKELKKDLKNRTRELRKMKIVVRGDSTNLHNALRSARISLDSANRSLMQIESSMMKFDFTDGFGLAFSGDPSMTSHGSARCIVVGSDSGAHRTMVIINGDTVANAPRAYTFKRFGTDSSNGFAPRGRVRLPKPPTTPDGMLVPPTPLPPMHFKIDTTGGFPFDGNRFIVIENDSVLVRNGANEQTFIRIQGDSTKGDVSTQVIIISKTKKGTRQSETTRRSDTVGTPASVRTSENVRGYLLGENIPNPFSQTTTITFTLAKPGKTLLTVFDATGKVVKSLVDADLPSGTHTATFDASDLPSGIYLYRLVSGDFSQTRTMTLQK